MRLFDLHCDTLYRAATEGGGLDKNDYHISFERGCNLSEWYQVMAVWIPDELRGQKAFDFVAACAKRLKDEILKSKYKINQVKKFSDFKNNTDLHNVILAVEGGAALNGNLENIEKLSELGVRFITLTWNGKNEIGDGAGIENPKGITEFGRRAVACFEENNIVVDVSHASEPLFWDVAEIAKKPFVATHSNSKAVCNHKRNLTDEQFKAIMDMNGLVGLNFSIGFLRENQPEKADLSDLINHAEHFLSLGGENTLCFGSDFDGTDVPKSITGIETFCEIYEYFLKHNYSEELVKKIFFKNALNFCENFDN